MTNIYDHHDKAFQNVAAYVIAKDGQRIGSIAFKRGESRVTAYVHFIGDEMIRGFADGGGYDKHSAACSSAVAKSDFRKYGAAPGSDRERFYVELLKDDGYSWTRNLENAGFTVWQAV